MVTREFYSPYPKVAGSLTLDQPTSVDITSQSAYIFTAPQTGNYRFTTLGSRPTTGQLYSDERMTELLQENSYSGTENGFFMAQYLDEGQTVYLQASKDQPVAEQQFDCQIVVNEAKEAAYEVPADSFAIHHKVHYGYFG